MTLQEVTKLPEGTKVQDYTGREWVVREAWPRFDGIGDLCVDSPNLLDGWTQVHTVFSREAAVRHTLAHGSTWCRAHSNNPTPVRWDATRCLFVAASGSFKGSMSQVMLNAVFTEWYMVDPGTDT